MKQQEKKNNAIIKSEGKKKRKKRNTVEGMPKILIRKKTHTQKNKKQKRGKKTDKRMESYVVIKKRAEN